MTNSSAIFESKTSTSGYKARSHTDLHKMISTLNRMEVVGSFGTIHLRVTSDFYREKVLDYYHPVNNLEETIAWTKLYTDSSLFENVVFYPSSNSMETNTENPDLPDFTLNSDEEVDVDPWYEYLLPRNAQELYENRFSSKVESI